MDSYSADTDDVYVTIWLGRLKPMLKAPDDAMEVTVYGRMWNFMFEYENGKRADTLYLPKDKPVKLNLVAMDVIHSLYIPAFRVKQDMVRGRRTTLCGLNRSKPVPMNSIVQNIAGFSIHICIPM